MVIFKINSLLFSLLFPCQFIFTFSWVATRVTVVRLERYNAYTKHQEEVSEKPELRGLYPPSVAIRNGTLKVDSIHELYYEIYGNTSHPQLKALFLHGGPGAGCFPRHAQFFDPDRYQVILMDQRGSGKSTPRGDVRNNTVGHLVEDCEALRKHLGFRRWDVILGGSWGSTLAIAYGQEYPASIGAIILRGVCLLRQREINWLFASNGGCALRLPQAWKSFESAVDVIEEASQKNPYIVLLTYYRRLLGTDNKKRQEAARAWMAWEFFVSMSHKIPPFTNTSDMNETMAAIARWDYKKSSVAVHTLESGWSLQRGDGLDLPLEDLQEYGVDLSMDICKSLRKFPQDQQDYFEFQGGGFEFLHDEVLDFGTCSDLPAQTILTCFFSVNNKYCMNNHDMLCAERLRQIRKVPCIAIQGGSDRICPPDTSLDLLSCWPEMELRVPVRAGHSMYDMFITNELVRATDRFAGMLECPATLRVG